MRNCETNPEEILIMFQTETHCLFAGILTVYVLLMMAIYEIHSAICKDNSNRPRAF